MASFGASVSATVNVQNAAFNILNLGIGARGATVTMLGQNGRMAGVLGSFLADEVRVPAITVASGTQISKFAVYSVSLVPTTRTDAKGGIEATFTVTGVNTSDTIFCNPPAVSNNSVYTSWRITATDTVQGLNLQTVASQAAASGTYNFVAFRVL